MDTRVSLFHFALFCALIAGNAASDDIDNASYYKRGDFAEIFLVTIHLPPVSKCYLVNPQHEEVDFQKNSSKYELRPSTEASNCTVRIYDLDEADEGSWSLHAETSSGEEVTYINVNIKINGTALENLTTPATAATPTQGHNISYRGRHHYPRAPSYHSYPSSSGLSGYRPWRLYTPHFSGHQYPTAPTYLVTKPATTAVYQERNSERRAPVLNAAEPTMMALLEEPALLACSSREPLLYCSFEAPNGTFISAGPGTDLNAGECSLRLRSLAPGDTGVWKCHAGFPDAPEQIEIIQVLEQEPRRCYYRCASGKCIMKGEKCDGFSDCFGGEDERNCRNGSRPWTSDNTVYYPTAPTIEPPAPTGPFHNILVYPSPGFLIPRPNMTTISPPARDGCQHCAGSQSDRVVVEMPGSLAADPDVHFALSLVPLLRGRTLRDKLDAQIDVLSYFRSKMTRDQK